MGIFKLGRDIKDLERLREIVTILFKQGFHELVKKAKLQKHAPVAERLKNKPRETTPRLVRETFEMLGPTFVKMGQVLSLRPDLIPQEYCDEFKKLQDDVQPLTFPVVKGVIESELKRPLKKIFKSFEHVHLAAASVSQVHKAALHNGTHVVVKIQRPGVSDIMVRDIDIMEYVAKKVDKHIKNIRALDVVEEFKSYTERELDFTYEVRNTKRFYKYFEKSQEVVIPRVYDEYSTNKVMVLEFIHGVPLSEKKELVKHHYDLHELASIGFRAIFEQVFKLGVFHADPHPGNLIAITRGKRKMLAMLDFGIVGFVNKQMQSRFLQLLGYLVKNDVKGVTWTLLKIGQRKPGLNIKKLEQSMALVIMDWHGATLQEMKMSALIYKLINMCIEAGVLIPPNVILVAKSFLTIEGAGAWLDPEFNPTDALGPAVKGASKFDRKAAQEELLRTLSDWHDVVSQLPVATESLLDKIEEGKFSLRLDEDEFNKAEYDYHWEMSRKNLTLVSAAFLLSGALLAALAPELLFWDIALYKWAFGGFLLTIFLLLHITIKTNKYLSGKI